MAEVENGPINTKKDQQLDAVLCNFVSILAALVTQHFATAPDSSHIRLGHCTALEFTHSLCKTGLKSL